MCALMELHLRLPQPGASVYLFCTRQDVVVVSEVSILEGRTAAASICAHWSVIYTHPYLDGGRLNGLRKGFANFHGSYPLAFFVALPVSTIHIHSRIHPLGVSSPLLTTNYTVIKPIQMCWLSLVVLSKDGRCPESIPPGGVVSMDNKRILTL